jgi:hypothetical protein
MKGENCQEEGGKLMGSEEITRRKFIENVAKYCGAGIAAFG